MNILIPQSGEFFVKSWMYDHHRYCIYVYIYAAICKLFEPETKERVFVVVSVDGRAARRRVRVHLSPGQQTTSGPRGDAHENITP
jgi:hypothetical protein